MENSKRYNWSEYDKKYHSVNCKFDMDEYRLLVKAARKNNTKVTSFVKDVSLFQAMKVVSGFDKDVNVRVGSKIDEDFFDQLRRLGNNHNQLLKKINIYGMDFILGNMDLINEIENMAHELRRLREEIFST